MSSIQDVSKVLEFSYRPDLFINRPKCISMKLKRFVFNNFPYVMTHFSVISPIGKTSCGGNRANFSLYV